MEQLGITARHGLQSSSQRKGGTLCALCCRSLLPTLVSHASQPQLFLVLQRQYLATT